MPSSPALIFHEDGSIEATPELKQKLQLTPGTRLELVQQSGSEVRFRMPAPTKVIRSWRDLEGILADSPADPNRELEQERLAELERDAH
jgi:hypothetical protein